MGSLWHWSQHRPLLRVCFHGEYTMVPSRTSTLVCTAVYIVVNYCDRLTIMLEFQVCWTGLLQFIHRYKSHIANHSSQHCHRYSFVHHRIYDYSVYQLSSAITCLRIPCNMVCRWYRCHDHIGCYCSVGHHTVLLPQVW